MSNKTLQFIENLKRFFNLTSPHAFESDHSDQLNQSDNYTNDFLKSKTTKSLTREKNNLEFDYSSINTGEDSKAIANMSTMVTEAVKDLKNEFDSTKISSVLSSLLSNEFDSTKAVSKTRKIVFKKHKTVDPSRDSFQTYIYTPNENIETKVITSLDAEDGIAASKETSPVTTNKTKTTASITTITTNTTTITTNTTIITTTASTSGSHVRDLHYKYNSTKTNSSLVRQPETASSASSASSESSMAIKNLNSTSKASLVSSLDSKNTTSSLNDRKVSTSRISDESVSLVTTHDITVTQTNAISTQAIQSNLTSKSKSLKYLFLNTLKLQASTMPALNFRGLLTNKLNRTTIKAGADNSTMTRLIEQEEQKTVPILSVNSNSRSGSINDYTSSNKVAENDNLISYLKNRLIQATTNRNAINSILYTLESDPSSSVTESKDRVATSHLSQRPHYGFKGDLAASTTPCACSYNLTNNQNARSSIYSNKYLEDYTGMWKISFFVLAFLIGFIALVLILSMIVKIAM
jgi:hypothetical protein